MTQREPAVREIWQTALRDLQESLHPPTGSGRWADSGTSAAASPGDPGGRNGPVSPRARPAPPGPDPSPAQRLPGTAREGRPPPHSVKSGGKRDREQGEADPPCKEGAGRGGRSERHRRPGEGAGGRSRQPGHP